MLPRTVTPKEVRQVEESGLFDGGWYVSEYPDVAQLDLAPAAHYLMLGAALGRNPSLRFDTKGYRAAYPETGDQNPLLHYLNEGEAVGNLRLPNGLLEVPSGSDLAPRRGDATPAQSHLPEGLRRRAKAATDLPWPDGASRVYRDVRAHFDPAYYIAQDHDMAVTADTFDLAAHFVRAGDKEGRSPNPHFSARAYRRRYGNSLKDGTHAFHHWLTEGRAKGMIGHPMPHFEKIAKVLGLTPADCQEELIAQKNDLRERLEHGTLGEMVNKAAAIEPLVGRVWRQALRPNVQPFHHDYSARRLVAITELQAAINHKRARAVVCVGGPRWGSNRRLEGHVVHALAALYGPDEVVFIATDKNGEMPRHKYPDGVRCINARNYLAPLTDDEGRRVLLEFLRSLRAEAYFNVNSAAMWQLLSDYGTIMQRDVPTVGCFFCNDKSVYGTWGGYPATQFYRQFDHLKAVCTDSHFLRRELVHQFYVPEDEQDRMIVLEAPVNPDLPRALDTAPRNARPQLFWAGRLDQQKRLDLVFEVARRMPHVDIRIWGTAVSGGPNYQAFKPENVIFEGAYSEFSELPLQEADAWFYTSEWDGVPSILLEVAMTGLPIVGSLVGGTGEVLRDGLSWPVDPFDDVGAYVASLQAVLEEPDAARAKAGTLRSQLIAERTEAHYQDLVAQVMACRSAADSATTDETGVAEDVA
ncbi:MAG: glycosyltransferase [Pseudomonadota bacterium]